MRALALLSLLGCFPVALLAQSILVTDPFSITGLVNDTAINVNIPARQSRVYHWWHLYGTGDKSRGMCQRFILIKKNSTSMGTSDALLLRTFHSTTGSQAAFRFSTDFGPQ